MSLDNCLFEMTHEGAGRQLRHVEKVADRSAPSIEQGTQVHRWDKGVLLKEIESGITLKHVEDTQDRSSPRVAGVQMHPNERPALLAEVKAVGGHHALVSEIKAGGVALQHVDAPADRSAPVVDGAQVGKWDKNAFLHEIEAPHKLKHVEQVADRSEPRVEPDIQIKPNKHGDLLKEIQTTNSKQQLRHVEDVDDRSQPQVTQTAALRVHSGQL